jgi:hypothetical protein
MAVVVIGGLLSSTVLTLLVVPALYTLFDDLQNVFSRRRVAVPMAIPDGLAALVPSPALAGAHGSARPAGASPRHSATTTGNGHGGDHGANGNGHANGHGNDHLAANGYADQGRLVEPHPEPESEGRSGRAT